MYVWEVAIKADKSAIKREEITYEPEFYGSPYIEVAFENINSPDISAKVVQVNYIYRFQDEFLNIIDVNDDYYKDTRNYLFNIFMHYISMVDLRQGLTKREYYLRFLAIDFLTELFGNDTITLLQNFTPDELHNLFVFILKLYKCGTSINMFQDVMKKFYPRSIVYSSNDYINEFLVYIGHPNTERELSRISFIKKMFLPIDFQIHLFWENHFGIIDYSKTMIIDKIMLF